MRGRRFINLFGKAGSIGTPAWVLPGAAVDLDFANSRYFGGALASLMGLTRASNGFATDNAGSLVNFAPNVPRITSAGLLIEETATNIVHASNPTVGVWSSFQASYTSNAALAPDGTMTAALASTTGANGVIYVDGNAGGTDSIAGNTPVTMFAFVKASSGGTAGSLTWATNGNGTGCQTNFDMSTGVTSSPVTFGTGVYTNSGMSQLGTTGWWIVWIQGQLSNTATALAGACTVTVPASSNFLVWGMNVHPNMAFVTSPIITTAASAVRAADGASGIGALLSAVGGSTYSIAAAIGGSPNSGYVRLLGINGAGVAPLIIGPTSGVVSSYNGGTVLSAVLGSGLVTGPVKLAAGFSAAGRSLVANNGTVVTDAAAFAAIASVEIGSQAGSSLFLDGYIKRLTIWNSRLSDATLKALTV